ncbi:MAG: SGNH/GDSL hydrolase family protein [Planctomycetota bacterium]
MPHAASATVDRPFAASHLSLRDYGLVLVQLVVLTVLVWQFHLEEKRHLLAGLAFALGGFAIHAQLPAKLRRGWFVALSLGALVLVLGPLQAVYALAVSAALIGTAVLPIAFWLRVLVLLGLAACCVWLRNNSEDMFWPIVGSMFMFRLLVYMHSVRRERRPSTWLETCSYFFLLPNAFFPLFPVVDYRTFQDTYYNEERRQIYQTGIHWMVVGVGHLLLYRLLKYELLPTPLEIRNYRDVVLFLATNYALYVRVSGHFHLICGMLHLFGFNLPRTHDHYFFASSFSDIWRRINIYWKDFMLKTFFFPAFFRARAWGGGDLPGVAVAVLWVFLWTWLAHSWQVFWLLGDFPFRMQDAALWLGVGMLVATNAMFDYRRAAASRPQTVAFSFLRATIHALKVLGVFSCVSLFWAHWSNPEILKMLLFSTYLMTVRVEDLVIVFGAVGLAIAIGVAVQYARRQSVPLNDAKTISTALVGQGRLSFDQSVGLHLVPLIGVLLLSQPPVYDLFGKRASTAIAGLQVDKMNRAEALAILDGYYEELNDKSLQAGPFLGDPAPQRRGPAVDFGDMIQQREDLLEHELIPNWTGTWSNATITINRWGMRDRDRAIAKPAGTRRIALIGSSLVMGFGVGDEQTFSRLLEEQLNADAGSQNRHYEVLNFGVGRYSPLHRRLQIEHKVIPFHPDLIVYFAHQDELYTSARRLATAVYRGIKLEDVCLDHLVQNEGFTDSASEAHIHTVMERHHAEILRCTYRRMAACRVAGVQVLYVYLPAPGDHNLPFDPRICLSMAAEAGIETADLSTWWGDRSPVEVLLGKADYHPNALGHRLLAEALEEILRQRPALLQRTVD